MSTLSKLSYTPILTLAIAAVLSASQAQAAAFQLKENSAKGLGRAFAGSTSTANDLSVIASNPASMRLLEGRQFQADLSAINFSAKLQGGASAKHASGADISGGRGGDAGLIAPVPVVYFHLPLNEDMHLGFSMIVPFGLKTEYDRNWVGRYHGVKTEMRTIDLGAAFSWDVNPFVSLGASVFVERLDIEMSNAIDFGAILANAGVPGYVPGNADGFSTIEGNDTSLGYVLGSTFSLNENTHIALSYRSKVEHKITDGTARFEVPTATAATLAVARPGWFINTAGQAKMTLPASATLSASHQLNERWAIMADISHTYWKSAFDQVTVKFSSAQPDNNLKFGYKDTTFASIGSEYQFAPDFILRAGLGYDPTPTTSADRDVRVPDSDRTWLSLGLSYFPIENTEFSFGYTHLFMSEPKIDIMATGNNNLVGKYKVNSDILSASIHYRF